MTTHRSAHDLTLLGASCMVDYETPSGLICMSDGAIYYKFYVLKWTMAVDNCVSRIIKGAC